MLLSYNLEDGATALKGKTERTARIDIGEQKTRGNIIKAYKIMNVVGMAHTVSSILLRSYMTRSRGTH